MENNTQVKLTEFGFYSLANLPSMEELELYYANTYYQNSKGSYCKTYSEKEILLINNKLEEKQYVANLYTKQIGSVLDIGCGEGWAINFFKKKGINICGLDFSQHGCACMNPDCLENLIAGDLSKNIHSLIQNNNKYDLVLMSNLLEHVINPFELLKKCYSLVSDHGVLVVTVPNDFSVLQKHLLKNQYVDNEYWIESPDHISYFNKESLSNLAIASGWKIADTIADYPIDFSLFNKHTNYVLNREVGKSVHLQRVEIENLFYSRSIEKTVNYYRSLADLGFGRQIITFLTKN